MWQIASKLALGMGLIVAASAVLLLSDLHRRGRTVENLPRVALVQYASNVLLDTGARGVMEGLAEAGLVDGKIIAMTRYNAEADMPTANAIAAEVTGGQYQMVITISTPCLQVVASANKAGKTTHVFGLVTDPYGAGVGITGPRPEDHPPHLAGIGSFQPVEHSFDIAREMLPGLKRVGVVWSPSEACSQACTNKARTRCSELGIELLEATVDATAGVGEAAQSLVSRDVQAIWVGGDNTVQVAIDTLLRVANAARIPVFTNTPLDVKHGALFSLGSDYREVGRLTGQMAAQVLRGRSTRDIPIGNIVPELLAINTTVVGDLREHWSPTTELLKRATILVTSDGTTTREAVARSASASTSEPAASRTTARPTRTWNVHLVAYQDTPPTEASSHGVRDGLIKAGLVEGRDYTLKSSSAQGDVATLSTMIAAARSQRVDMLVALSTPTLQIAARQLDDIPVIFTCVASGVLAGAGRSETDHKPNVTGITTRSPFEEMAGILKQCMPDVRAVGTLFTPAEVNSVLYKEHLERALKAKDIALIAVPANNTADIADAALSLSQQPIDAICQISDNLTSGAFASISKQAENSRLPVFGFVTAQASQGAVLAVARDYYDAGVDAGLAAARVICGEDPARIPFTNVKTTRLIVNRRRAASLGVRIPEAVVNRADKVID